MKSLNKLLLKAFSVMLSVMLLNLPVFADRFATITQTASYIATTTHDEFRFYTENNGNGGGAVFLVTGTNELTLTVRKYDFSDNSAGLHGGAIAMDNNNATLDMEYNGVLFARNSSTYSYGGAISNFGNVSIGTNAFFMDNTANGEGGAIYNTANINIGTGAQFISNEAIDNRGGAICNGSSNGSFTLGDGAKFIENSAKGDGGAIYTNIGNHLNTDYCFHIGNNVTFSTNTSMNGNGGAISAGVSSILTLGYGATFSNNSASNGEGGAIFNKNKITIDSGASFTDNTAQIGGAISNDYTNTYALIEIGNGVSFSSNTASNLGGAIANGATININNNANFINNTADRGGAIYNTANINIGTGAQFINNEATGYRGGAIYNEASNGSFTLGNGAKFIENSAKGDGGAIYTNIGNPYTDYCFSIGNNVTFSTNTSMNGNGGAISAGVSSILILGDRATFNNNSATNGNGGAIFNKNILTIGKNASFTDNTAKAGGAIYSDIYGDVEIGDGVSFSTNTAMNGHGGAIHNSSSSFVIGNSAKFKFNTSQGGVGGAIYNKGNIEIGQNAEFFKNLASGVAGGAIYNSLDSTVIIGANAKFKENSASVNGSAIYNEGTIVIGDNATFADNEVSGRRGYGTIVNLAAGIITFTDGAIFENNTGGAISNRGILNLTANSSDVVFTGNALKNGQSYAIDNEAATVNLWTNEGTGYIIFNDKITGDALSTININQSSGTLPTSGRVVLNEDMSGFLGTVNLYNGTIELGENGQWFGGDMTVSNLSAIYMANSVISEHNFHNLTINNDLKLIVDADLANGEMDTISATSFGNDSGKIKVTGINILSDIEEKETEEILFANDVLKDKVETTLKRASSLLYTYGVKYDNETGNFIFTNMGSPTSNMSTAASAISASVGGYATQSIVANQVLASMDGKVSNSNNKASIDPSNLYVSAGDQVFENSGKIERGLWLRPFVTQETVKIGDAEIDNNLYGTLAGIDFPMGQDKQVSFYLGYAGSKQEIEEIKSNQTGYILGATGMIIKDKWYAGATANIMFNKASVDTDFGTDDIDMNMFSVAAKAGYNFNLTDKFILEPSLMLMYGVVNSDSYETSQGAQIDSQSVNNILAEPQVKAKLQMGNGWQPYGLVGYAANLSSKPTVKTEGLELELDSIDGYVEYGAGVNKDFIGTVWSCYAQVTGRSGGRNGFSGNLGVKYKF